MNQHQDESAAPDLESEDYYFEGELMVFTAAYLLKRGSCCKSACRHCPYGFRDLDTKPAPDKSQRTR